MKALVLNELKQPLIQTERPPLAPAAGEVVVKLTTAALNRRDYWITQGLYPGITPPVVPGSDGAGQVSRLGAGVDASWQDQEVIINPGLNWGDGQAAQGQDFQILGLPRDGTFATEVAVPASQLHVKPAHLNWEESAALPLAGLTAYRALFVQGELQAGQTVLVTGIGGGVATFALMFAVAAGARVWVTSSSAEKIERAVTLGAQGGFDYTDETWVEEFRRKTNPPQLIIDSAGGSGYAQLVDLIAPGGRIVNFGATAGPLDQLELRKVFWKQIRLQGSTMGSPVDFAAMLQFVSHHGIKPKVDATFPLADGNRALEQMAHSPQFGKYVLTIA